MQGTMKAARLNRIGEPIRIEDVPIPEISNEEVLIRVLRAGMNRGDQHLHIADFKMGDSDLSRQLPYLPMTVGHDGIGEIVEVGPGVDTLKVGDRVIVMARFACGQCRYCLSGREHLCIHHQLMGYFSYAKVWRPDIVGPYERYKDGLWAEYSRIPVTNLVKLRPDDDIDTFARITEVANGYRALKRGNLAVAETVLVNGATGVTGTAAVHAALAMGAAHIIAIARDPARLKRLQSISPRRISVISIRSQSIQEEVAKLTENEGANLLLDLSPGDTTSTLECLQSLEPGGRAVIMGGSTGSLEIGYRFLMVRAIDVTSSLGRYHEDIPELVKLVRRGVIDVSDMQPQYYKLDEFHSAIDSFVTRSDGEVPVWPMMRAE